MVSNRAINDIMQTPKKEVRFLFFSVCCVLFNCSWQLMFDKKQKSCIKRIHLVTDDGLCNRKAFYKVEIIFIHPLWMMANLSIINILRKHRIFSVTISNIKKQFQSMSMYWIISTLRTTSSFDNCSDAFDEEHDK